MGKRQRLGIKPGRPFLERATPQSIQKLLEGGFDYIEYQAPVPNLRLLAGHLKISPKHLLPHSVFQSLSLAGGVSKETVTRLKGEVKLTRSKYLAEHIGSINPESPSPSHYYLYPPQLNKKTLDYLVENAKRAEHLVGCPIALENSVFYQRQSGDELDYLEFLRKLDQRLPSQTGWLLDVAHLIVSAQNLSVDLMKLIEFFNGTKRPIFEIHLSAFIIDKNGVASDSHIIDFQDRNFLFALSLAQYILRPTTNLTLEVSLEKWKAAVDLVPQIENTLKSKISLAVIEKHQLDIFSVAPTPKQKTLKMVEWKGRKDIAERHLNGIFSLVSSKARETLLNEVFVGGVSKLAERFLEFSAAIGVDTKVDFSRNIKAILNFLGTRLSYSKITPRQARVLNILLKLLAREDLMVDLLRTGRPKRALLLMIPDKFGKPTKKVLLTISADGKESLKELRVPGVWKLTVRSKTNIFAFGGTDQESEMANEKEKHTQDSAGRSRIIRRRSLNNIYKSECLEKGDQQ